MKYNIFVKKSECWNCSKQKHFLVSSTNGMLCRECYSKEAKFLYDILLDIFSKNPTKWDYDQDMLNTFKRSTILTLKKVIKRHYEVSLYNGEYQEEIIQIIKSLQNQTN